MKAGMDSLIGQHPIEDHSGLVALDDRLDLGDKIVGRRDAHEVRHL